MSETVTIIGPVAPAFKIEPLRNPGDVRAGNTHEVFAPDGMRFANGPHSWVCGSLSEAMDWCKGENVEPCPADCDCKD